MQEIFLFFFKTEDRLWRPPPPSLLLNGYRAVSGGAGWGGSGKAGINQSSLSSADIQNEWNDTSTPLHMPIWRGQGQIRYYLTENTLFVKNTSR
jgi:hypothetical protein